MANESKSTILIATISAISAIVIALITTYGTIAVSAPKAEKVKDEFVAKVDSVRNEFEGFLNLHPNENLPVGTIVSSMLRPSQFAEEVGDPSVFDPKISKWALADSVDDITLSEYGKLLKVNYTPDLRGMFLRGMNEGRNDGRQDPQPNRKAGNYQGDAFARHDHGLFFHYRSFKGENQGAKPALDRSTSTKSPPPPSQGGNETRPKNVAVYFYIKIN